MTEPPTDYAQKQAAWLADYGPADREGAVHRVDMCDAWLNRLGFPVDDICVVGCHDGIELARWQRHGATRLLGVEGSGNCPPGFNCSHCWLEQLGDVGRWNVYASHVLEHCYDLQAAVAVLQKLVKDWLYVALPIEPVAREGSAHYSRFSNLDQFLTTFSWLTLAVKQITPSRESGNIGVEALFVR